MTDIFGIDNALLDVGDLAAAKVHYAALGLAERFTIPDAGIAIFAIGDERPGILLRARPDLAKAPPTGPRIWLEVADARAATATITLAPETEPFEIRTGWAVEYADPWGNVVGLADYAKASDLARTMTTR